MKRIICAGVIFIDKDNKILLEDRREIKKHGEHWSFFGGTKEKGETDTECLLREIKEELHYNLENYTFFLKYDFQVKGLDITYHMYTAPTPYLKEVKVHTRASLKKFSIKQALRLKMTPADKDILRELNRKISQKKK